MLVKHANNEKHGPLLSDISVCLGSYIGHLTKKIGPITEAGQWLGWSSLLSINTGTVQNLLITRRQNFKLVQIETNCRRHFKVHLNEK